MDTIPALIVIHSVALFIYLFVHCTDCCSNGRYRFGKFFRSSFSLLFDCCRLVSSDLVENVVRNSIHPFHHYHQTTPNQSNYNRRDAATTIVGVMTTVVLPATTVAMALPLMITVAVHQGTTTVVPMAAAAEVRAD